MAAATSSSQKSSDPWDLPNPPTSSRHRPPVPAQPVRDDWEDDDVDDPQTEQDNRRIWEDANARAPNPMPAVIISPSATSPHTVMSPPPGAFQPAMRILKRPSAPNSNPPTPPPASTSTESLKEREARYQAARERIFGAGEEPPPGREATTSPKPTSSRDKREKDKQRRGSTPQNASGAGVARHPRGPTGGSGETATPKGFDGHRAKPPSDTLAGSSDL
ncbi:putative SUZ domain containing protein [Lyophyllum shimeji]|uniref:SUZ domain containing protein n=1 Tax=Lyophyllum shimeji TaxID=47721 RepID=A0A9P3PQL0_LYOSH|nr:putative SUZ domain containing protein [Lyophyllum shimeji]